MLSDDNSLDSVSRHGSDAATSSMHSTRIIAPAKQASLRAMLMSMDKKQKLRLSKAKLHHDIEGVELQTVLEAACAEENVLSEHEQRVPEFTLNQDNYGISSSNTVQTQSATSESTTQPKFAEQS